VERPREQFGDAFAGTDSFPVVGS